MENPVSNLPAPDAREVPFLPAQPPTCACGAPLDMEMERDEGRCVNCAFEAAVAFYRGETNSSAPSSNPLP